GLVGSEMCIRDRYYVDNLINIPCSSSLTEAEVEIVVDWLKEFKA
ncbi:MAG: hypothetical protein CI949_3692, partial [Halanaerobium sp.]